MAKRLMTMLFLFLAIHLTMAGSRLNVGYTKPPVPAIYIFGDSTFDVGTNNFLEDSTAKATKRFYGIDYPYSKPTGRFSNGYNTADRIVNLLGFQESPPPFFCLALNDTRNFNSKILKGVNFASGGSGILNGTGKQYVRVVTMAEQIQQFTTVSNNISQYLNSSTEARINKSLFLLSVGSNDIFEFFLINVSKSPANATQMVQAFIPFLMDNYQAHLKNLINLGARRLGIVSVPPIGCVPIVRGSFAGDGCLDSMNFAARLFHTALEALMLNLSSGFPDLKYSIGNTYNITSIMIDDPAAIGLSDVKTACCGNATFNVLVKPPTPIGTLCGPDASLCENRDIFLFWDQYHPTAHASNFAALSLFSGEIEYVAPTNFSVLVQLS